MWVKEVLTDAMATPWTPQQVATLEQTLGSETVLEAVKRNELEAAGLLERHTNSSPTTALSAQLTAPKLTPTISVCLWLLLLSARTLHVLQMPCLQDSSLVRSLCNVGVQASAIPAVCLLPPPPDWTSRSPSLRLGNRLSSLSEGSTCQEGVPPTPLPRENNNDGADSDAESDGFGDFTGSGEGTTARSARNEALPDAQEFSCISTDIDKL